jgi:hypothetical protein
LSYYGFTPLYAAARATEVFGGEVAPGGLFMCWLGFVAQFGSFSWFYNLLCALKMGCGNLTVSLQIAYLKMKKYYYFAP